MQRIGLYFMSILLVLAQACGTKSKAGPYAKLTLAEQARQALDQLDYPKAIDLYTQVITADPTDYESYRFLGAAYAGNGGFDLLQAVQKTLDGGSNQNLLDTLGSFVPADPTDDQISSMSSAVSTILQLPAEYRSHDHPEIVDSSSAAQQLEFYQAASSIITINKFAKVSSTGTIDPSKLDTMTDADVDQILDNFKQVAATSGDPVLAEGAAKILADIAAAPGDSQRDKLIQYLKK